LGDLATGVLSVTLAMRTAFRNDQIIAQSGQMLGIRRGKLEKYVLEIRHHAPITRAKSDTDTPGISVPRHHRNLKAKPKGEAGYG
jgi:hypothetical protein